MPGLDAVDARDQHAGGPVLEVARRQAEKVLEHLQAQHRVDAVAHVEDEVLAHPGHRGGENHKHRQTDADHRQRVERVMDNHFVNHYLGEQRRCERHQLDCERREEYVAEDAAVLQQFGDEPAEAEFRACRAQRIRIGERLFFRGGQQHLACIDRFELTEGQDGMAGLPLFEQGDTVAFHSQ